MLYLSNWTAYTFCWNGVDVAALLYAQKKTDKNLKDVSNQVVNKSKTKKTQNPSHTRIRVTFTFPLQS